LLPSSEGSIEGMSLYAIVVVLLIVILLVWLLGLR
jgi:hypothetical protein